MLNPLYVEPARFLGNYFNKTIKIEKLNDKIITIENFYNENRNTPNESNAEVRSFLEKLFYINHKIFDGRSLEKGKGKFDLAISNNFNDRYKVLMELKKPNSNQMIKLDNFKNKAFYQAIYYYLSDKSTSILDIGLHSQIQYLIITDYISWYIIRTSDIDDLERYKNFPYIDKSKSVEEYYEIFEQYFNDIENKNSTIIDIDLPFTSFDLRKILSIKDNLKKEEELKLFLKVLSPQFLLSETDQIDKNNITNSFYKELFYIIGLEEDTKDKLIKSKNKSSFLSIIQDELPVNMSDKDKFNKSLELILIWISRILFIQLFSSILIKYKILNEPILSMKYNLSFDDINTLFFDILNSPTRDDTISSALNFSKIPYINSELFQKTKIELETNITIRKLASNKVIKLYENTNLKKTVQNKLKNPNVLSYLIAFLNSYDIAVDENFSDSSDKDLINASVLGMVFEKLNGYSDGSFYTPSYITEYMSNNVIEATLIQKFNEHGFEGDSIIEIGRNISKGTINKAKAIFNEITLCDPAVGSGHYLVSSLNTMLLCKVQLGLFDYINPGQANIIDDMFIVNDIANYDKYKDEDSIVYKIYKELYESKREIISNSIFGVDINPKSVYISRLRLWIELLKHTYFKNSKELILLPNIDINIKQGNSLISEIELAHKFDNIKHKEIFVDYKKYVQEYKNPNNLRSEILIKINEIKYKLNNNYEDKNKFEWRYEFPEILDSKGNFIGFDIIIGNPPYLGEKGRKDIFRSIKKVYKDRYEKNSDLFYFFFMKSIDVLKNNGRLGFITTNYFLTATGASKLRSELKSKTAICNLINFNDMKLFNSALGQHNIITILKKTTQILDTHISNVITSNNIPIEKLFTNSDEVEVFIKKSDTLYDGKENYIRISKQGSNLNSVFQKMLIDCKAIGDICFVNTGFNTGADRVTKSNSIKAYPNNKLPNSINLDDGIFILNEDEYLNIKPEKKLTYKCYKNSDIEKYSSTKWQNLYVIWTSKDVDIDAYSNIKSHLIKYSEFLKLKREFSTGQLPWYSQHWPREYDVFGNKDKIIFPYRAKSNIFSYSTDEYFGSKDILYLRQKDKNFNIKYLLALLNSKLYYIWLYYQGKRKGEILELYVGPIKNIPVKNISNEQQQPFIDIIDNILEKKLKNHETLELENKLNSMVYELYKIDENEILVIDKLYYEKITKKSLKNKKERNLLSFS